ncbi:hypothetical protein GCM10009119_16600 [Algoriphagus jejuensis]|uniref:Uncharacterized protein n=1 Tax=Algoriphagus jejuensis TaxID=419934 RepID=A0ABP3YC75_9BACT
MISLRGRYSVAVSEGSGTPFDSAQGDNPFDSALGYNGVRLIGVEALVSNDQSQAIIIEYQKMI